MENYDIFISYKRRGASNYVASFIYSYLKEKGYSVFLDHKEMDSGKWNAQLYDYIQNAKDVIVLLEEGSLMSCERSISVDESSESESPSFKAVIDTLKIPLSALSSLFNNVDYENFCEDNSDRDVFCKEITLAIKKEVKITLVQLNGYKIPADKNYFLEGMKDLADYHALDFKYEEDFKDFYEKKLVKRLNSKPESEKTILDKFSDGASPLLNKLNPFKK